MSFVRWAILLSALGAGAARAQNVSDLMPSGGGAAASGGGSASGTGGGTPSAGVSRATGYWFPGMPLPAAPAPAAAPAAAAPSGPTNGGRGQAMMDSDESGGGGGGDEGGFEGPAPDTHVVKKGDTLWDISSTYFKSHFYWPKLWSFNPLITNPHWIYPGDVVRLRPDASAQAAATPAPSSGGAPKPGDSAQTRFERRSIGGGFTLRQNGFVEQGELKQAAKVIGSPEEKLMLTTLDEAYVEYSAQKPLHSGERHSIYRVLNPVKRPGSSEVLGSIVEVLGELEVRGTSGGKRVAKAVITDAVNPIERGYFVGPLRRQFKVVDPVADRANVDARVAATLTPTELVGEQTIVFIDRGHDDGLEAGNRMVLVRRGDGYAPLLARNERDDARFPREVVGEVLVVDVRGKTSTGLVTRSTREVGIGDQLEARKGY